MNNICHNHNQLLLSEISFLYQILAKVEQISEGQITTFFSRLYEKLNDIIVNNLQSQCSQQINELSIALTLLKEQVGQYALNLLSLMKQKGLISDKIEINWNTFQEEEWTKLIQNKQNKNIPSCNNNNQNLADSQKKAIKINDITKQKRLGISDFLSYCQGLLQQQISISLCDQSGKFIFYNQLATDHFEGNHNDLNKISLFDLIIPLSMQQLQEKQNNMSNLVYDENNQSVIKYTIYSEKSKKKYLKYFSKFRNNLITDTNLASLISTNEDHLFYKYLKSLSSRVTIIKLNIEADALQQYEKNETFIINKEHPLISPLMKGKQDSVQALVVLVETRLSKQRQEFIYDQLIEDQKIKVAENKLENKMKKLNNLRSHNTQRSIGQQSQDKDEVYKEKNEKQCKVQHKESYKRLKKSLKE